MFNTEVFAHRIAQLPKDEAISALRILAHHLVGRGVNVVAIAKEETRKYEDAFANFMDLMDQQMLADMARNFLDHEAIIAMVDDE